MNNFDSVMTNNTMECKNLNDRSPIPVFDTYSNNQLDDPRIIMSGGLHNIRPLRSMSSSLDRNNANSNSRDRTEGSANLNSDYRRAIHAQIAKVHQARLSAQDQCQIRPLISPKLKYESTQINKKLSPLRSKPP